MDQKPGAGHNGLSNGYSNEEQYWLRHKVAWKVITKQGRAEDIRQIVRAKDSMVFMATNGYSYVVKANPDMYAAIRKDNAGLLIAYAKSLEDRIIPNYKAKPQFSFNSYVDLSTPSKPSASTDPSIQQRKETLRQNEIDNREQNELRSALWRLQSEPNISHLVDAYSRPPRNDDELNEVMDSLSITGKQRDDVLRKVNDSIGH